MNIFILDLDLTKCAQYHCDQHVIKMILEYTQILCTVCNLTGEKSPYKSTHIKHPCVLWANASLDNWLWLKKLNISLHEEYQYRYGATKQHKSFAVSNELKLPKLPQMGLTEFAQTMPEKYRRSGNPVNAYRNFYAYEKSKFATWTKREIPRWYVNLLKDKD